MIAWRSARGAAIRVLEKEQKSAAEQRRGIQTYENPDFEKP